MQPRVRLATAVATFLLPAAALAQPVFPPPENVLQLTASHTVEVPQDLLRMQLGVTREGTDATQVQAQLKAVLDSALAEARAAAVPGGLEVRTGNFSLYPRHNREGRISGWQGTAELVIEGRDFARMSELAGRLKGMTLSGIGFGLSREQRQAVEQDAQAGAVSRFRARAGELAKAFGFSSYSLREVAVHSESPGVPPRPRMAMAAMEAKAADAPVPVEPGKEAVTVSVSGSVQLR